MARSWKSSKQFFPLIKITFKVRMNHGIKCISACHTHAWKSRWTKINMRAIPIVLQGQELVLDLTLLPFKLSWAEQRENGSFSAKSFFFSFGISRAKLAAKWLITKVEPIHQCWALRCSRKLSIWTIINYQTRLNGCSHEVFQFLPTFYSKDDQRMKLERENFMAFHGAFFPAKKIWRNDDAARKLPRFAKREVVYAWRASVSWLVYFFSSSKLSYFQEEEEL